MPRPKRERNPLRQGVDGCLISGGKGLQQLRPRYLEALDNAETVRSGGFVSATCALFAFYFER